VSFGHSSAHVIKQTRRRPIMEREFEDHDSFHDAADEQVS